MVSPEKLQGRRMYQPYLSVTNENKSPLRQIKFILRRGDNNKASEIRWLY